MTATPTDDILSKVRKILALTTSPNQHEAEAAMAMAQDMMIRHNLTIKDLDGQPAVGYIEKVAETKRSTGPEAKYIFGILEKYFFVKVYSHNVPGKPRKDKWGQVRSTVDAQLTLVGTPENVEVALYIFHYLKGTFRRLFTGYMDTYFGRASEHMLRKSFYIGLRKGLGEKLDTERYKVEQELAMVLVADEALIRYMEDKGLTGGRSRRTSYYADAHSSGLEQGRNIQINPGIGTRANQTLLLR